MDELKQLVDLYRGAAYLKINDLTMPAPTAVTFVESIYSPFRKGTYTYMDPLGMSLEMAHTYVSKEGRETMLYMKNMYIDTEPLQIPVEIYNTSSTASKDQNAYERRNKQVTHELIERPFFLQMTRRNIRKMYSNKTADQIIQDILMSVFGYSENEVVNDINGKGPIIKSFICPNWNFMQVYEYLKYRVDNGPMMVFPTFNGSMTLYRIHALGDLMKGAIDGESTITYSDTMEVKNNEIGMRADYTVKGPSTKFRTGFAQGETVISFDYFSGGLDGEKRSDYGYDTFQEGDEDQASYSYEKGLEEYKNEKDRYNKSLIGGMYKKGVELYKSCLLGSISLFEKEKESDVTHAITIDIDSRKEVEAKIQCRFIESMHDILMLEATVMPIPFLKLGGIYNVKIPSVKEDVFGKEGRVKEESLSGKWILVEIVHNMKRIPDGLNEYVLLCKFVKSGLEKDNSDLELENF
jgi:hypothetical protein